MYVFAPATSQLRGKHRLRPGGLATVIRQVLAPQSWGWFLRPTRLVPALRRPFSFFLYVNVGAFKKSLNILSLPLADFIAPADCSSWELRLRQSTALGGTDVAVAPGGGRHIAFFSHVDLPLYSLRPSGHWRLWARLLNVYSSPLESPMDVNSCLRRRFSQRGLLPVYRCSWLPLRLRLASTTCFYDLPL